MPSSAISRGVTLPFCPHFLCLQALLFADYFCSTLSPLDPRGEHRTSPTWHAEEDREAGSTGLYRRGSKRTGACLRPHSQSRRDSDPGLLVDCSPHCPMLPASHLCWRSHTLTSCPGGPPRNTPRTQPHTGPQQLPTTQQHSCTSLYLSTLWKPQEAGSDEAITSSL